MKKQRSWIAVAIVAPIAAAAVLLGGTVAPGATGNAAALDTSPSPWPSPSAGVVLQVGHNGSFVKQYTLDELKGLTPFPGYTGFKNDANNVTGPEAVTGVKITDIVQDELGAAMSSAQSILMRAGDGYKMKFTYDQIASLTGFSMWDATTKDPVSVSDLTGPLATTLVYSAPAGDLLNDGPLRFMIVDATSENAVMTGSDSIYNVAKLDVLDQVVKDWSLKLTGLRIGGKRQTRTITRNDFQSCVNCHASSYRVSGHRWSGIPLYYLVGEVDGGKTMDYNVALARKGYRIRLTSAAGISRIVRSGTIIDRRSIVLAWLRDGQVLGSSLFPLRLMGPKLTAAQKLGRIKSITLLPK